MQPTQPNERYHILDVLRGFALIGVLIANMSFHSGFWFLSPEQQQTLDLSQAGNVTMWLIHFITDGKFYSIFSILFGIGFALQLERSMNKGEAFVGRFSRRLLILFIIGLVHGVLFYVGDILMVYALMGFVLLLFRKASNRSLILWAVVLLIAPIIQYAIMWGLAQGNPVVEESAPNPMFEQLIVSYRTGSFGDAIINNIGGLIFGRFPDLVFTGRFFKVLAMFLLGYYIARRKLYVNIQQHKQFFKKIMLWTAVIGIPCNLILAQLMISDVYYSFDTLGILEAIVYAFGVPALGIFYACGIVLLYQKARYKALLSILSPFGRMALTNYFTQSVICCLIYKGYGLGLFALDGPVFFTLTGIGILIFQIAFSHFWLKYFNYGPLEWIWRSLTYKKWQPYKKKPIGIEVES